MTLENIRFLLFLLIHLISILCQANAFFMEFFPIDSPHLQILPKNLSEADRTQLLINISLSRSLDAQRKGSTATPNSVATKLSYFRGSYLVSQLSLGDQITHYDPYVVFDTFSDITWIQCSQCDPCFPLDESFSLEKWSSFTKMGMDDKRCIPAKDFNGSCGFEASLGDGHTEGFVAKGTFMFENKDVSPYLQFYPNIAFGCGIHNNNFNFMNTEYPGTQIAGVMGVSPGPKSFVNQLDMAIKSRFSYCITPPGGNASTTITFGDSAKISGDDGNPVQTIEFKPDARYHVNLAAIVVNGVRLRIDPIVFALDAKDYKTGFFIDPASPATVLAKPAYSVVRHAMVEHFKTYGYHPVERPDTFDLCYAEYLSGFQVYPTLAFNLLKSGGDTGEIQLVIPPENLFGPLGITNGFCLLMLPSDGPSILGALQQVNHRFLFDLKNMLLSFVPQKC